MGYKKNKSLVEVITRSDQKVISGFFVNSMKGNEMKKCRNEYLNCRLSEKEKYLLEVLALNDGRSLSEMVREMIRKIAEERGIQNIGLIGER